MTQNSLLYCATDKEIYDVLMSAKQKINSRFILELAKDRGIFYSAKDSRESLAHSLSLLQHDYYDLNKILEHREHASRAEKLTSITLNEELTLPDIKELIDEFTTEQVGDEKVTTYSQGANQQILNLKYSDVDYGKTRLVQRTPKEARFEFHIENNKTTVRMPANSKANEVFSMLKEKLEAKRKKEIVTELIEIGDLDATQRTQFFVYLTSKLEGFKHRTVTSVKVEPIQNISVDDLDDDDQEVEQTKQEALAMIRKVALNGDLLLVSEEYQSLLKKGFFITSIIWRAAQTNAPWTMVEFEAAFDEPETGKGFKYLVRGELSHIGNDTYTKTLKQVDSENKNKYNALIEKTASLVIAEIRSKDSSGK